MSQSCQLRSAVFDGMLMAKWVAKKLESVQNLIRVGAALVPSLVPRKLTEHPNHRFIR